MICIKLQLYQAGSWLFNVRQKDIKDDSAKRSKV